MRRHVATRPGQSATIDDDSVNAIIDHRESNVKLLTLREVRGDLKRKSHVHVPEWGRRDRNGGKPRVAMVQPQAHKRTLTSSGGTHSDVRASLALREAFSTACNCSPLERA